MVSGYQFAGLEYGAECHCGNRISSPRVPEEDCSLMCRGERGSPCGGVGRLSIYKVEEQLPGHRKCECLLFCPVGDFTPKYRNKQVKQSAAHDV